MVLLLQICWLLQFTVVGVMIRQLWFFSYKCDYYFWTGSQDFCPISHSSPYFCHWPLSQGTIDSLLMGFVNETQTEIDWPPSQGAVTAELCSGASELGARPPNSYLQCRTLAHRRHRKGAPPNQYSVYIMGTKILCCWIWNLELIFSVLSSVLGCLAPAM